MKKAVLAVTALFAAVTATPAMAAEFAYGGFMRYRYITGNPGTAAPIFSAVTIPDDSASFMEYRVRQFFNLDVNDHVTTNVKFEWNSFFGDQGGLAGANGDLQVPTETEFRIKNAFVRFDVPGAPLTLTVGQQDFSTPKAIISVEDYTGVKATINAFGGAHNLFWARLRDTENAGFQTTADDGDWFGFVPQFKAGDISISPHISYVKSHGATAGLANAEVWFLGVDASGKAGPVGFTADFVYQTGEAGPTGNVQDLGSFVLDVSASLAVGPGTLTLKGLYSPGDDNPTDTDNDMWVNVVSTDMGWSPLFHDGTSISNFAGNVNVAPVATVGGNLVGGGIMAVGAEFALSPVANLTVTPNVYYLMAAEDVNLAGGGPTRVDDFYGIEAGVQANWRLWDAVNILAQFDYLFAGDVFENNTGQTEDVWRVVIGPHISW